MLALGEGFLTMALLLAFFALVGVAVFVGYIRGRHPRFWLSLTGLIFPIGLFLTVGIALTGAPIEIAALILLPTALAFLTICRWFFDSV